MTSSTLEPAPTAPRRAPLAADSAGSPVPPDDEVRQRRVEGRAFRATFLGMAIGAVVCALLWCGLMLVAMSGAAPSRGPMLLVGAGCGLFAGIFLGGWAGSLVGAGRLEHHEHETLPHA